MPENMRSRSLKAKNKENSLINRLMRFCRYWWIRLVRLQGHPREIARGFALGVFSGFFPWMGLQIIENLGLKPRRFTAALLLNMSIVYEIYAKI